MAKTSWLDRKLQKWCRNSYDPITGLPYTPEDIKMNLTFAIGVGLGTVLAIVLAYFSIHPSSLYCLLTILE